MRHHTGLWLTRLLWLAWLAPLTLALAGCDSPASVTRFEREHYPQLLSAWGVVTARADVLELGADVLPYDLNTPLFTDYAHKLRTVWMPQAVQGTTLENGLIDLPEGTVLSKTFYYPRTADGRLVMNDEQSSDFAGTLALTDLDLSAVHLIETRLLVRHADGWDALTYLWNPAQRDAELNIVGDIQRHATDRGELTYVVPTRDECASCHTWDQNAGPQPIGLRVRHLAKDYGHYASGPARQLDRWRARGYLDNEAVVDPVVEDANADWADPAAPLEDRARSYLDINCGHCHNPSGPADTSGLILTRTEPHGRPLGLCKPPIAAGRGSGGLRFSIVPGAADASILTHRMRSTEPDVMMPELGRTTVHTEGVALIERWIDAMSGGCD